MESCPQTIQKCSLPFTAFSHTRVPQIIQSALDIFRTKCASLEVAVEIFDFGKQCTSSSREETTHPLPAHRTAISAAKSGRVNLHTLSISNTFRVCQSNSLYLAQSTVQILRYNGLVTFLHQKLGSLRRCLVLVFLALCLRTITLVVCNLCLAIFDDDSIRSVDHSECYGGIAPIPLRVGCSMSSRPPQLDELLLHIIRKRSAIAKMLADNHGQTLVDPADGSGKARRSACSIAVWKMGAEATAHANLSWNDLFAVASSHYVVWICTKDFHKFRSNKTQEIRKPVWIFVCRERKDISSQHRVTGAGATFLFAVVFALVID
mmetsp:Transcript_16696/g.38373  ORF Transcript_16696/g.38373 Transcript_16696/m.38373 type:complete len:320 (+) Transcript_16696:217-1176(+)